MKFKIFEQFLYNFESEEHIKIEPITTSVTMYHDKYDYNFSPEIIFANISNSYEIAGNFFENKNNISVEEYDKNLEEITIPSTAESIENFTFFGFNNLISVNIPDSVISIGETAFFGCKSLINIFVDEKSNEYSSIDGVLFDKKLQTLIAYPQNKKNETYVVPNSVKNIRSNAFFDCENIINIILPSSIENIGEAAFCGCKNLANIELPDSIINIGSSAFCRCASLKTITLYPS